MGEMPTGPSPKAPLGLVLMAAGVQPGDFRIPLLQAAIAQGRRSHRAGARDERPETEVPKIARHRVARRQPLDLESVARPQSVADRALRVVDLLDRKSVV